MINKLKKIALITGGSGGIGSNICKELAKKNYRIYFTYLKNKKNAEKIIKEIKLKGGFAEARKMDIKNINSIKKTLNYFKKKDKKLSILINNSGISQVKSYEKISIKDWENMININLRDLFFNKIFLKNKKDCCRIINISSSSGLNGRKF